MFNVHPRVFFLYLFYFAFFFFTRSGQNEKHLSLFLLPSLKLTIFLILYKNMSLSTLLILAGRVSYMNCVMGLAHHRVSVA